MRAPLLASALTLGFLGSAILPAQSAPPTSTADQPTSNPAVTAFARGVQSDATARPLDVRRMDLRVTIRGGIAISEMNLWVHGTTAEAVEGRLSVVLPTGSVVTGYGLDVDGQMVDGSLVPAARAEAAYSQQVRGQIDPGLGKVDAAGTFNTRISPSTGRKAGASGFASSRLSAPATSCHLIFRPRGTAGRWWSAATSKRKQGWAAMA